MRPGTPTRYDGNCSAVNGRLRDLRCVRDAHALCVCVCVCVCVGAVGWLVGPVVGAMQYVHAARTPLAHLNRA